jgi:MFS family permease
MAVIGASIGLMFAVSLLASPVLAGAIGLPGLFAVTGVLALAGIAVIAWWTPPEPLEHRNLPQGKLSEVLTNPALLRLDIGVFILHAVQLAMWVALPQLLVDAGLPKEHHWYVYLPTVLASFVVMGGTVFPLERRGYLRAVFLWAIGIVGIVQLGLVWAASHHAGLVALTALLFVFFCGFNALEASQPSMASRFAPAHARGAALGVYNTLQSVGFFVGGAVGGTIAKDVGSPGLFAACAVLMVVWLVAAWPMKPPPPRRSPQEVLADEADARVT